MDPVIGPWKIFPVIYFLSGLCFNSWSLITTVAQQYRHENLFIYYCVIVVANLLTLLGPLLLDWAKITFNVDIRLSMGVSCSLHRWISHVAKHIPPWVLVVMAFEKRSLVWFPIPADSRFSRVSAKRIMAALCLTIMCIQAVPILSYDLPSFVNVREPNNTDANAAIGRNRSRKVEICDFDTTSCDVIIVRDFQVWPNFFMLAVGPYLCLIAYTGAVVRKIMREKWCADRLLMTVGVAPPSWFYEGITEMQKTVVTTSALTFLMFATTFTKAVYDVTVQHMQDTSGMYSPRIWVASNAFMYLNYVVTFPVYALQDQKLVTTMLYTWQKPFIRKRGSHVASSVPRFQPDPSIGMRLEETRTERQTTA